MDRAQRVLIAGLGLMFCLPVFAAPYPTADQLRKAIIEVTPLLKSEQLEVEILDAQKQGISRPLMAAGLDLDTGTCLVFYNIKPEAGLTEFFQTVPAAELPVWLNSIAVHELTHCIEQREAYVRERFDKVLPPGYSRDHVTVQGYLSVINSGAMETWGEALADIASVLYLRQALPDRWNYFANGLAAMRHDYASRWPEHDTSAWLHKVIAAGAETSPNQDLFETAFQLRRQYRPEDQTAANSTPGESSGGN
jgi:hypothetical protein